MSEIIFENDNYSVSFDNNNSTNVTVVFSSGGALALAQPIEEFKKTISKFDTSYIFVRSKKLDWYNNIYAIKTMKFVSNICNKFQYVFVTGESLGGSGAILFAKYCKNIFRILAFSPQYSALPAYCHWYGPLSGIVGAIRRYTFSDYSIPEAKDKALLLFPTISYEDNLHAKSFKAEGFEVTYIKTRHHDLARHFKKDYDIDYLHMVMQVFYNKEINFNSDTISNVLHAITFKGLKAFQKWIGNETYRYSVFLDDSKFSKIQEFAKTNQSSILNKSPGNSTEKESANGFFGKIVCFSNFCTEIENNPWWMIEFLEIKTIQEIRIFNQCDKEYKCRVFDDFSILYSTDNINWYEKYRYNLANYIGGEYGEPFVLEEEIVCKYIKIRLNKYNSLHLTKIEFYE